MAQNMKIKSLVLSLALFGVTPALAQEIGAGHVLGNPSASQASPTDATLTSMFDRAFCGTNGQSVVRTAGTWVCGVPSVGTVAVTIAPQHRVTLASGTPVMTASQAAKTTVFVTPYAGNLIPIYDGATFTAVAFAETSQATTDNTKSPAAVGASSVYDIFCWVDAGTNRCTRGPAWTNTTTRSAGTALVAVNGVYLNNALITNGPAASRGTYVGSVCSDGASQINYIFGASSSGGTAANFCVWNAYNRVSTGTTVADSGASYTYAVATVRQARASSGNQINFLLGLSEDAVWASVSGKISPVISTSGRAEFGLGFDSITVFSRQPFHGRNNSGVNGMTFGGSSTAQNFFGIGVHYVAALENSPDATASTYDQDSINTLEAIIRN
jgi:hypothetical protein